MANKTRGADPNVVTPTLVTPKPQLSPSDVRRIVHLRDEEELDREDIAEEYGITAVYVGQLGRTCRFH